MLFAGIETAAAIAGSSCLRGILHPCYVLQGWFNFLRVLFYKEQAHEIEF